MTSVAGLGVAYTEDQQPPSPRMIGRQRSSTAAREQLGSGRRLLVEPGRALVANGCVTLYTRDRRQAERLDLGQR